MEPPVVRCDRAWPAFDFPAGAARSAILASVRRILTFGVAVVALGSPAQLAVAATKPTLAALLTEGARNVTNCGLWCGPRDLIDGSNEDVVVWIRPKPRGSNVNVTRARLALQGDHRGTRKVLTAVAIAGDPGRVTVAVGGKLHPDHYRGAVLVDPSGAADEVVIPVSLNVRTGPEIALLFLLGSVLAGLGMGKAFGLAPKREFTMQAETLRRRIIALPTTERAILTPLFENTWKLRGDHLDTADKQLAALEAAVPALRRTRELQDSALANPARLTFVPWLQRVAGATSGVVEAVRGYDAPFDKVVAAVETAVDGLTEAAEASAEVDAFKARADAVTGRPAEMDAFHQAADAFRSAVNGVSPDPSQKAPQLRPLLDAVGAAFKALEQAAGAPLPPPPAVAGAPIPSGLGEPLAVAETALGWPTDAIVKRDSGWRFDVLSHVARLALPFASLAAAIVLLAVGFKVTYLDNPTFGATTADYLALIIWGLAAWGARQTLTGLGPPAPKSE
jgi:hypothetical protein